MKIENKEVWGKFVYELIFPAILGSMLYDIFDINSVKFNAQYLFKIIVITFYCIDYLFVYSDIYPNKQGQFDKHILLNDFVIPIFYRIGFAFISSEDYNLTLISVSIVIFIITTYNRDTRFDRLFFTLLSVFLLTLNLISFLFFEADDVNFHILSYFGLLLIYGFYVFHLHDKYSQVKKT